MRHLRKATATFCILGILAGCGGGALDSSTPLRSLSTLEALVPGHISAFQLSWPMQETHLLIKLSLQDAGSAENDRAAQVVATTLPYIRYWCPADLHGTMYFLIEENSLPGSAQGIATLLERELQSHDLRFRLVAILKDAKTLKEAVLVSHVDADWKAKLRLRAQDWMQSHHEVARFISDVTGPSRSVLDVVSENPELVAPNLPGSTTVNCAWLDQAIDNYEEQVREIVKWCLYNECSGEFVDLQNALECVLTMLGIDLEEYSLEIAEAAMIVILEYLGYGTIGLLFAGLDWEGGQLAFNEALIACDFEQYVHALDDCISGCMRRPAPGGGGSGGSGSGDGSRLLTELNDQWCDELSALDPCAFEGSMFPPQFDCSDRYDCMIDETCGDLQNWREIIGGDGC